MGSISYRKGEASIRGFALTRTSASRGFTLIELLVVIAIIGILSSVVLASLTSARQKSRDARRLSDIRQMRLALELYYSSNLNTYPTTAEGLAALAPTYIPIAPSDPSSGTYQYRGANSSTECTSAPCSSYVVRVTLEGENGPTSGITGTVAGLDCSPTNRHYCVRP